MTTKDTKQLVNVSIGVTATYISLGMVIIGIAIYTSIYENMLLSLPLFYLGILLILTIRGFTIDKNEKMIKKYIYFFPFKIGSWKSIEKFNKIVLALTHDTNVARTGIGAWSQRYAIRTRHFEVYLSNENDETFELIDYPEYKRARFFLKETGKLLDLEINDLFEESVVISKIKRHWNH